MNISTQPDMLKLIVELREHYPVVSLRMVREKVVEYASNEPITSAKQAFDVFKGLVADLDREAAWLMCLDTRNKITCLHRISEGTLNGSLLHPREVFKTAVLSNSAHIIIAHNHPSGDPSPSPDDIKITKRIQQAGEVLGIKLLDHLVI